MTRTIRLSRKYRGRRIDFGYGTDRTAALMAMFGLSGRCIAQNCGFSSPSLVYYRNHKSGIRIRDFRDGNSPVAALVIKRLAPQAGAILDAHLERMENAGYPVVLRIPGLRSTIRSLIRQKLLV